MPNCTFSSFVELIISLELVFCFNALNEFHYLLKQKLFIQRCTNITVCIYFFNQGAMENWGLVTYRETALLIDPKNSSSKTKQWVALVVGHELAHQWFGNLVTMVIVNYTSYNHTLY